MTRVFGAAFSVSRRAIDRLTSWSLIRPLSAFIRVFTFGAYALVAKASEETVFAPTEVFVTLSVLEVISVLFYEVIWCKKTSCTRSIMPYLLYQRMAQFFQAGRHSVASKVFFRKTSRELWCPRVTTNLLCLRMKKRPRSR